MMGRAVALKYTRFVLGTLAPNKAIIATIKIIAMTA
jgi:hypothetical protein